MNRFFMYVISISQIIILSACAGSPARLSMMSEHELRQESSPDLCNAYAINKSEKFRIELERRHALPPSDWAYIDKHEIATGMTVMGLLCLLGAPSVDGDVNQFTSQQGVMTQWVYRDCQSCKAMYVYTKDGKVISWQN